MKALPTSYLGYSFRSRLEARWAVFFNGAGVEYWYESQGYRLSLGGQCYLPDFWLPGLKLYAEVKGDLFSEQEERLCSALAAESGFGCLLLLGPPAVSAFVVDGSGRHPYKFPGEDWVLHQAMRDALGARFDSAKRLREEA